MKAAPPLSGKRVLITAGPTRVMIDAVRYLSNVSSGFTGAALAREFARSGAEVHLLLGRGQAAPPEGIRTTRFETFDELHELVRAEVGSRRYDAVIHAAAVSDYRPVDESAGKMSSERDELVLRLQRTPKIVDEIKELDPSVFLVKFKLEVGRTEDDLLRIARESAVRSRADLVVANDLHYKCRGRHVAYLLEGEQGVTRVETSAELARALADELAVRLTR